MAGRPRIYSEKQEAEVKRLIAMGMKVRDVALALGIPKSTVQRLKARND